MHVGIHVCLCARHKKKLRINELDGNGHAQQQGASVGAHVNTVSGTSHAASCTIRADTAEYPCSIRADTKGAFVQHSREGPVMQNPAYPRTALRAQPFTGARAAGGYSSGTFRTADAIGEN